MFESVAALIPPSLLFTSGAVFNSGRSAFSYQSPLYVLGLNHCGCPEKHRAQTVSWHTKKVSTKPDEWAEYQDESWDNRQPGTAGMQPRGIHL